MQDIDDYEKELERELKQVHSNWDPPVIYDGLSDWRGSDDEFGLTEMYLAKIYSRTKETDECMYKFIVERNCDIITEFILEVTFPSENYVMAYEEKITLLQSNIILKIGQVVIADTYIGACYIEQKTENNSIITKNDDNSIIQIPLFNFNKFKLKVSDSMIDITGLPSVALQYHDIELSIKINDMIKHFNFNVISKGYFAINKYRMEIARARYHTAELYNYIQYNYEKFFSNVNNIMVYSNGIIDTIDVNNMAYDYDTINCMGLTYYVINFDEEIEIESIDIKCNEEYHILLGQRNLFLIQNGFNQIISDKHFKLPV